MFLFFIELWLTYNVVLITSVQESYSVICVCVCVYILFFILFSIMVYHRILNIVPCAVQ